MVLMAPLVTVKQGRIDKRSSTKPSIDRHGDRWKVVHEWKKCVSNGMSSDEKPGWSHIARQCNKPRTFVVRWVTRYKQTGSVQDEGVGRKQGHGLVLGSSGMKQAHKYTAEPLGTASKTATRLAQEGFPKVSRMTISRVVKTCTFPGTNMDEPLAYKFPRRATSLSVPQKAARVKFCNMHRDRAWKGVLFTDSKIFEPPNSTKKKGLGPAQWVKKSQPHEIAVPKHAPYKLHAYGGINYYGKTKLHIVTGTSHEFKRLDHCRTAGKKGAPCSGVCGYEYNRVLTETLLAGGDAIWKGAGKPASNEWVLQQDGAKCHWTPLNKATIAQHRGNNVMSWPANSPDLSPIENIWCLIDAEIKLSGKYDLTKMKFPEYKAAVFAEWENICKPKLLRRLCGGMHTRMRECIALQGAKISKW